MNIKRIIQEKGKQIHEDIITSWVQSNNIGNEEIFRDRAKQMTKPLDYLPKQVLEGIIQNALDRTYGNGVLSELLRDENISEIMVNGTSDIYVERNGKVVKTSVKFESEEELMHIITRIVSSVGRRIDIASPLVDARLKDGSRVNAIIPPLSLNGPILTIRKFNRKRITINEMVAYGSLTIEMAEFLRTSVQNGKNIVISGGTGSGKTSLLTVCGNMISENERIITIEDSAEIKLELPHVLSLESRVASIEGTGDIPIRALIKNALRMRPDRIIVGEIRSGEALDMLQAMNTGHSGSLTTVHASSPLEALFRIETMAMMSDLRLPLEAIQNQIISSIDLIVQQVRTNEGKRKITQIAQLEKTQTNDRHYNLNTVFTH